MISKGTSLYVIGERINPTSRKKLTEEIREGKTRLIEREASEQERAGVDAIDLNVRVPGIDECEVMRKAIRAIQKVCDLTLVIDSASPETLEAGLGEAGKEVILNSIHAGDFDTSTRILTLANAAGAAVIALAFDGRETRINWKERLKIAKGILQRAESLGFPEKRLLFDPLNYPLRRFPAGARHTLLALRALKEELGVSTCIGLSNISYGLKARSQVNEEFLRLALAAGLDAVILDPLDPRVMKVAREGEKTALTDRAIQKFVEVCA